MKIKKEPNIGAQGFRETLSHILRRELSTAKSRDQAAKATNNSKSTIENMVYKGGGSLDSWFTVLEYCFKLKPNQLESLFIDFKTFLRKQRKLTPDEVAWSKTGESLTKERRLFWSEAILAVEDIERKYREKKKKKS